MFYEFSTVVPKSTVPSECRNIVIKNVHGSGAKTGIMINGLPEKKLKNIVLENVDLTAREAIVCKNAENNLNRWSLSLDEDGG